LVYQFWLAIVSIAPLISDSLLEILIGVLLEEWLDYLASLSTLFQILVCMGAVVSLCTLAFPLRIYLDRDETLYKRQPSPESPTSKHWPGHEQLRFDGLELL